MKVDTLIKAVRVLENRAISRNLTSREMRQLECFSEGCWNRLMLNSEPLVDSSINGQKVVGKHKIPRFMYHLTTEDAYNSMLRDGRIIPSECSDGRGVFLFDLKNFAKFWRKTKNVGEEPKTTLLNMLSNRFLFENNGNIVLLRIPTNKLDAGTLRLRIQEKVRCGRENYAEFAGDLFDNPYRMSESMEGFRYSVQGEKATNYSLCNQRKQAVEFITPSEVSMDDVQVIGRANIDKEEVSLADKLNKSMPKVWQELTKGSAEAKAFNVYM